MNFFYEAIDANGQTVLGKIDGSDLQDAQRRLLMQGYQPQSLAPNPGGDVLNAPSSQNLPVPNVNPNASISFQSPVVNGQHLTPAVSSGRVGSVTLAGNAARVATTSVRTKTRQSPAPGVPVPAQTSDLGGVSTRDMMLFFQQLASLVRSGISIYSALDNLAARTPNKHLAQTAREMAEKARTGGRISDVMAYYHHIYPEHIVGTVRAGELGGFLEIALAETALNYEQNIALYRGAWIPKVMATQAFFIIPIAQPFFSSLFNSMDLHDNVVLFLKLAFLRNLPIALALYFGAKWVGRRLQLPQYRYLRDSWSLRMRPFGDLQRQAALSAFVRMLRRLYQAGVSPIHAWEGAMNTASNVVIRDRLASAYEKMQQGATLAEAFQETGLFHNSIEQLMITGHQSGQVVEMLDQAAEYYQMQAGDSAKKARFMMFRFGVLAMLIFGGGAFLWLVHTYFGSMFSFTEKMFPELNG